MPSGPLLTIDDYGERCREILPRALFDILFGSYGDPHFESLTNNLDGFRRLKLRPRVLAGVGERCLETTVLGQRIAFPVMLAPAGSLQRCHPEGELAAARAAGRMGTLMALSTAASFSIEEVARAASGPLWFQLYFFKDRELNRILVRRAEQAGYKAILLTVDNVTERTWEREYRHDVGMGNHTAVLRPPAERRSLRAFPGRLYRTFDDIDRPNLPNEENFHDVLESNLQWSDLDWLRSMTSLPIVVKGIQTAEDALLCVEHGADGLVVSNHGGHTVNNLRGTIDTLPEVADAVGGRLEIYLDGGVRKGTDVLKALALGARAVFIGRPIFWGLTLAGEDGVAAVLEILRNELYIDAGRCGVRDVRCVDKNFVHPQPDFGRRWTIESANC
jgi:isopentenyl diphosphate isomerase/L-lactate dehydrogenase-like FMN-dependent dehydrogenase